MSACVPHPAESAGDLALEKKGDRREVVRTNEARREKRVGSRSRRRNARDHARTRTRTGPGSEAGRGHPRARASPAPPRRRSSIPTTPSCVPIRELRANTVTLAKIAALAKMPVIYTASEPRPIMEELVSAAPGATYVGRKGEGSAWDNADFVKRGGGDR